MRKNSFILIVIMLMTFNADAQGYRGKRFVLTYQPSYTTPQFFDLRKFYVYQRASVGYVLSNHILLNAYGQYGKSKYYQDLTLTMDEGFIKDVTGGLQFLFFRKLNQCYAPIGKFVGIGFEYGRQNSVRKTTDSTGSSYNYYDDVARVPLMVVSATLGRNFLFANNFIFGLGVQYSYCFGDPTHDGPIFRQLVKPFFNIGVVL